jgi:hypothetical protein
MPGFRTEYFARDIPLAEKPNVPYRSKLRAALTVVGSFFALLGTFGQMISFGTYESWYVDHQLSAQSSSNIAWIGSLQLWIFFFSVRRHSIYDIGDKA